MKIPYIDKRNKEDILNYIKEVAPYYAPSWRFDENDMDMGSILALIFSEMFQGTIERLNKVPYKNFLTFLECINSKIHSSIPAEGYITLKLVDGIKEGILVKKGEKLSAQSEDSESIIFETTQNIYVTPADIQSIYNQSFKNDSIVKLYEKNPDKHDVGISLFNRDGDNLQKHEFVIENNEAFYLQGNGIIRIYFDFKDVERTEEFFKLLCNTDVAKWTYFNKDNYVQIKHIHRFENYIQLGKDFIGDDSNGECLGKVKCEIFDVHKIRDLNVEKILLSSEASNILPSKVFSNDIEQEGRNFFAFKEKFSVYDDFYISSKEVFSKKGSDVVFSFDMGFEKVAIEELQEEPEIKWKLIMRKAAFKKPKEYEISVGEVIWEYWNGNGWARLYTYEDYSEIFNNTGDFAKRRCDIKFKCPEDMDETIVNSYYGYFIRVRILKIFNAFMTKGFYISPVLNSMSFSYKYNTKLKPTNLITLNNTNTVKYESKDINNDKCDINLISRLSLDNNSTYFGFDLKPEGAPIKILFDLESRYENEMPIIVWEYFSNNGWKILSLVDETENMRKSGIISFLGDDDFQKIDLFNEEKYWIRIYNPSKYYENNMKNLPKVKGIYVNTTSLVENNTQEEELFFIDKHEKNKICNLIMNNINKVDVWVNEYNSFNYDNIANFNEDDIDIVENDLGEVEEVWVKWIEVEDLIVSKNDDRHYIIDKNEGSIFFGDGINGKIPNSDSYETIKVSYSVGGGEYGNIEVGQVNNMLRSLGYINKVFNPLQLSGGCNMETVEQATKRIPTILQNRGRAVTLADYENLVKQASRDIKKVKCFTGINSLGKKEAGAVTLVILQNGEYDNNLRFIEIKEQIDKYLVERNVNLLNDKSKFNIISPSFIEISIKVDVEAYDLDSVFSLRQDIEDVINRFIDPLTGNVDGNGWDIGRIPTRTQILNSLKKIKNIKRIVNIVRSASISSGGFKQDIEIDTFEQKIYSMPVNGKHKVNAFIK